MAALLLAALALGVAGLDPLGALLIAGALAGGASRAGVCAFTAAAGATTVTIGTAFSVAIKPALDRLGSLPTVPEDVWLLIDTILVVLLLLWGIRRVRRGAPGEASSRGARRMTGIPMLIGTGVVFALSALTDPAFYAVVVVLAGRGEPVWLAMVALAIWFAVSQSPLMILTLATVTGGHERLARGLQGLWQRGRPILRGLGTAVIFTGAAVLAIDAGLYLISGGFLLR